MKFKPGNRWKSSKSEVRYKSWRKSVFELNRAKKGLRKYYVCEKCNKEPISEDTAVVMNNNVMCISCSGLNMPCKDVFYRKISNINT